MKLRKLNINGVGGIKNLELSFRDNVNVICGANGIGKTTILDIIADAFSANVSSKLKRNALCECGKYNIEVCIADEEVIRKEEMVENFQPIADVYRVGWQKYANSVLYFGIDRNIHYAKLAAVASDPERKEHTNGKMAVNGIQAVDLKNWFVNRYMFVDKENSLTPEQIENYHLACSSFSILDDSVTFYTVLARTYDIMLSTSKGNIYFEYLSSGYKSCIYIIFGIIKELEYRLSEKPVQANEFDGIILIDEVDLHLHPIWQAGLIKSLKTIFPKAQFILTTHSPSVLQSLDVDEIIPLGCNEEGQTCLKELELGKYGLQGWTLEEILKYVMDMPSTTSSLYRKTLNDFDIAMNNSDEKSIIENYKLLKEMLHPNNPLQTLLSIQIAEWEE